MGCKHFVQNVTSSLLVHLLDLIYKCQFLSFSLASFTLLFLAHSQNAGVTPVSSVIEGCYSC